MFTFRKERPSGLGFLSMSSTDIIQVAELLLLASSAKATKKLGFIHLNCAGLGFYVLR